MDPVIKMQIIGQDPTQTHSHTHTHTHIYVGRNIHSRTST